MKFYFEMVGGTWTDMTEPDESITEAFAGYVYSVNTMGLKWYIILT